MSVRIEKVDKRPSSAKAWIALALACAALVAGVLAAVSPVERLNGEVTWDSRSSANPVAVTLMNPVPKSISAQGSLSSEFGPVLETFSGPQDMRNDVRPVFLSVRHDARGLTVDLTAPYEGVLASSSPLSSGSETKWTLQADGSTVDLALGDEVVEVSVPEGRRLIVNWLEAGLASEDVQVTITTSGLGLDRPAPSHALLIVLSALLALGSVLLLWPQRGARGRLRLRWTRMDSVVTVGIAASAVVAVPHYDDGWYLARSRLLAETGWSLSTPLADPFWGGIPNVQGFLYESLLGLTVSQSSVILILRLVPVLLMVGTWLLLAHRVLPRLLGPVTPGVLWTAAGLVLIWSLGWMTLRPEVLTAFLSVVMLAIFPKRHDPNGALKVVGLATLAALGLATHQSALVLIPIVILGAVVMLVGGRESWVAKLAAVVLSAGVAITLAFANQTVTLAREGLSAYTDLTGHARGPLDEWMRIAEILRIGSMAQRLYFILGALAFVALALVLVRRLLYPQGRPHRDLMLLSVALMPLGLLFTSSKWGWHYGALLLPFVVGLVLSMRFLGGARRPWLAMAVVAVFFPLAVLVAARPTPVDGQRALIWGAVMIVAALVILTVPVRHRSLDSRSGLVVVATSVIVIGAAGYHAVDFHLRSTSGWSFLGQTLGGLVNEDARCGVPSYVPALDPRYADAMDQISDAGGSAAVTPGQYLFSPCIEVWSQQEPGVWHPIPFSMDLPTWSLANLPGVEAPRQTCLTQPYTDQPGLYPTCFLELLGAKQPQLR